MAFAFGQLVGVALVAVLIAVLTSPVAAITLQVATNESLKFTPSFRSAYKVSLQAGLVASAICCSLAFIVGLLGKEFSIGGYLVLCSVAFLSNATYISTKLSHPENGAAIGFGRACWITTIQIVFGFMLAGAFIKLFEFITK